MQIYCFQCNLSILISGTDTPLNTFPKHPLGSKLLLHILQTFIQSDFKKKMAFHAKQ